MRRRILLLVAATTSAVVLAFVIPLCLLVRNMAADRAVADGDQEARSIAVLVSSLSPNPTLADAVAVADSRSVAVSTVLLGDGTRIGPVAGGGGPTASDLARARTGEAFTTATASGTRIVVPVVTADAIDIVHTWVPIATMRSGVEQAWIQISLLGLLLTSLALTVADQLGRRVSTPVTRVARVADLLREGNLDARAVPEGPPETRALATALNQLGERIEELLLTERSAVGDLSHRLRTPLTALRIDVERVDDVGLAERLRGHVGTLQRTVDAIVKDARRPLRHQMDATCDAVAVVRTAVDFWSPLAEDEGRPLDVDLADGPLHVDMDGVDLRDVVDILIDNVFAHTPEGTRFAVRLRSSPPRRSTTPSARGGCVTLEVVDVVGRRDGAPEGAQAAAGSEEVPEVARSTSGSGLGLAIARRTVASGGGELHLETTEAGTQVTVRLRVAGPR